MPKNRQKSASVHPDGEGRNNQPTMHSNGYISLAWWPHSTNVQMGIIRPDGVVAEHVEHDLNSPLHIIADGLDPNTAHLEPGWFVQLDEAGLKEHIHQCRRAGRRVFGWGNTGDRDPVAMEMQDHQAEKPQILQQITNHGWPVQPDGLDTVICLMDELGNPNRQPHYGHVWQYEDQPTVWCPGVPR